MTINITKQLDECYYEVQKNIASGYSISKEIPQELFQRIEKWDFGGYGWTSPVNIMMTAAWYKWLHPSQDICKIWASDSNKKKISGGFSIRNKDETYTVPFLNKFRLTEHFASPNSGMQGSRALEKNRLRDNHERINRDSDLGQSVQFDLELFKNIMNDIDDSKSEICKKIFMFFIEKSLLVQSKILEERKNLLTIKYTSLTDQNKMILDAVNTFKDPQFVKAVVVGAADEMIKAIPSFINHSLAGVNGSKTAADARANTPGDFWIINEQGEAIIGFEVKDPTKTIGFDVLGAIQGRIENYSQLKFYLLISAAEFAVSYENKSDPQWKKMISAYEEQNVIVLDYTVKDFIGLLEMLTLGKNNLVKTISEHLLNTMNLKKDTLNKWKDLVSRS